MQRTELQIDQTAAAPVDLDGLLTAQERACLRLVAQRMSSKEIAARLGIAKTSVDTYCDRARQKLGVSDRYAAARLLVNRSGGEAPAPPTVIQPPRSLRAPIALIAGGLAATALGVSALMAGMSALEAMKPPEWDKQVAEAARKADARSADAR